MDGEAHVQLAALAIKLLSQRFAVLMHEFMLQGTELCLLHTDSDEGNGQFLSIAKHAGANFNKTQTAYLITIEPFSSRVVPASGCATLKFFVESLLLVP